MFTHRLLTATAAVALVLAGTGALYAQPADGGQAADFFDRLDANHDGRIDAEEFKGPDEAFARMDKNGDGGITRDELAGEPAPGQGQEGFRGGAAGQADPARRWQGMLQRFDQNKDGQLSAEELHGREQVLRFLDANNDGVVTEDEAVQAGNRRGQGGQMDPAQRWQQLLENCDADDDGKISTEEWPARPEMFQRLDRDGDGLLVQDELGQRPGAPDGGARPDRIDPEQLMERRDADGDGRLSREEWPLGDEAFERLDANGDGFLSAEELQNLGEARRQRQDPARVLIQLMDKDGDGQVSDEEWSNFFNGADVDGDGMIDYTELFGTIREGLRPPQDPGEAEAPPAPAEGEA